MPASSKIKSDIKKCTTQLCRTTNRRKHAWKIYVVITDHNFTVITYKLQTTASFMLSLLHQWCVCCSSRGSRRPLPQVPRTSVAQRPISRWCCTARFCRRPFCTCARWWYVATHQSRPRTFDIRTTILITPLLSNLTTSTGCARITAASIHQLHH